MATNFIKQGDEFDYPNTTETGIASGQVVVIGDIVGVALTDILPGNTGTVLCAGVALVPKNTGEVWTQGQKIYYDPVNFWFTSVAGSLNFAGWAYVPALSADVLAEVKLKIG
jgi:predicted RecA/RadA family phage recombinase